jgi:hypothetical protein
MKKLLFLFFAMQYACMLLAQNSTDTLKKEPSKQMPMILLIF